MKRTPTLLILSLLLASCATMQPRSHALVSRAVQAMGGAETLGRITTYAEKGTVRQWEPEQSMTAGGEMRFANDATFEAVTDVGREATRIDWVRKVGYPAPRTFTFSELVTPAAGYVAGIDSNARTRQSLDSNPPVHTMSGLRLAATRRELRRASPLLLLEMLRHPGRVTGGGDATVGGMTYRSVDYRVLDQTFTVMFDAASGLPARIRTLDYDNIWGDVTYDLVLADWQTLGGVRIARSRTYELNARRVAEVTLADAALNPPIAPDRLAMPAAYTAGAPKPATRAVPYQWVIRRQFIGTYLDSDAPSYDTRATSGLRLEELAPGVHHVVGGSHHSLLVEMRDHLIVFDAPVSDWHSNWVLETARARFPGKPVRYLILTHHHMDHAGGVRGYVAQGATLVVGKGNGAHFRRVLASPFTRNPDLTARDLSRTTIVEVGDRHVISDGAREVHAYRIDNPHAEGLLIGYLPEARLGFVTDLWSPGAAPLPDTLNPALTALVAGVKKAGITPARFAGGHGSVADWAPLAALEGR
jgi:glyoxylase-like metal-dependent hydrolase (beta-lactamase superfamily II)